MSAPSKIMKIIALALGRADQNLSDLRQRQLAP